MLLTKSDENWEAGQFQFNAAQYNAAANRLYYGLMQSILAYAQTIDASYLETNGGLHTRLIKFIKNSGLSPSKEFTLDDIADAYKELMKLRVWADYSNKKQITRNQLKLWLGRCSKIRQCYIILTNGGNS